MVVPRGVLHRTSGHPKQGMNGIKSRSVGVVVLLVLGGPGLRAQPSDSSEKKENDYDHFAKLLASIMLLREGGIDEAIRQVPNVRNFTRGYIAVHEFIHTHKARKDKSAQLAANLALNEELTALGLKFGKVPAKVAEKINKPKTKVEKLYNETEYHVIGKITKAFTGVLGEKGVDAILKLNEDLAESKLNAIFAPAALLPYQKFANQATLIQDVIIGLADNKVGININPCLISYQPSVFDATVVGINFQPTLATIAPAVVKAIGAGINIQPALMNVVPAGTWISPSGLKVLPIMLGVIAAGSWVTPAGALITPFGLYASPQGEHINPSGLFITNITHLIPGGFLGYPDSVFYSAFTPKGQLAIAKGAELAAKAAAEKARAPTSAPGGSPSSAPYTAPTPGAGRVGPAGTAAGLPQAPTQATLSINPGTSWVIENTGVLGEGPELGPAAAPLPELPRGPGGTVGPQPLPRPAGRSPIPATGELQGPVLG